MKSNLLKAFPLLFVFALAGCEQQGPAESAGESLDNAAENTSERIEEGSENMQREFEN